MPQNELDRGASYFGKFAKRLTISVGLGGLVAGGFSLAPSVSQYFQEIPQALSKGEIGPAGAMFALCCLGPGVLTFGLIYRAIRSAKGDDEIYR